MSLEKYHYPRGLVQKAKIKYPQKCYNGVIEEPRVLGLVMVPGRHIVSIHLDDTTNCNRETM
ncbi:hypothetical protein Cfor_12814 [Coptotermes formosanus]|uniref:Uncharacterized protein n=1 Tax=Coptotermes formosanus TaxID=36987 RepID=A0A6L2QB16_COPFO|nr:hypothetical protein Cfor_12814 [Coptotermes formosanus]